MKTGSKLGQVLALAAIVGLSALQTGCGRDVGAKIAAAILPADAPAVTASVNQKLAARQFREALDEGASFLKSNQDPSGQLAWALAKASAQLGHHDLAVSYASAAVKADAVSGVTLMAEPLMEPVRTDFRYTSLAAGLESATHAPAAKRGTNEAATGDVSVTAGVEASAGDVSVKLPD